MNDNDLFSLLTNESDASLYLDMVTGCHVERIFEKGIRVKLTSSGIDGYVSIRNISKDHIQSCFDVVQVGQCINCCVLSIDKLKFSVELSMKIADVDRATIITANNERLKMDENYCKKWDDEDETVLALKSVKKIIKQRIMIQHPLFQNVDFKEAELYLMGRMDGELVVRPSTKGHDHLSITLRISEGIFQHIGKQ